jgi:hypothetical protein
MGQQPTIMPSGPEPDSDYLTTPEAAKYLRKSVSWILRQGDIAYVPGKPNVYAKQDLDRWFQKHKVVPRVRITS